MPHDPVTLLSDIAVACEFIVAETRDRTLAEYEGNRLLSAAVERHFITIGEALARLGRVDSHAAESLGNYPQIIAFRNIVVHGYDIIEHSIVWGVVRNEVPRLHAACKAAMQTLHPHAGDSAAQ